MSLDHRIDRLTFAIDLVDPGQAEALQNRLSDFAALRLPGLLSEVMDTAGGTDLRLDRLALDLGDIPAPFLEDDLARRFEAALSAALRAHRDPASVDPQGDPPPYGAPDVSDDPEGHVPDAPWTEVHHEEDARETHVSPSPSPTLPATASPEGSDGAGRDAPPAPRPSARAGAETVSQATGGGAHASPRQHHAPPQGGDPIPHAAAGEDTLPAAPAPDRPADRIGSGAALPPPSAVPDRNAHAPARSPATDPDAPAPRATREPDRSDRLADHTPPQAPLPPPSADAGAPDRPADRIGSGAAVPPSSADAAENEIRPAQSTGPALRVAEQTGRGSPGPAHLDPSARPVPKTPQVPREPAAPDGHPPPGATAAEVSADPEALTSRTQPGRGGRAEPQWRGPDSAAAPGRSGLGQGDPAHGSRVPPAILRDLAHYLRHGTYPTWPGPDAPDLAALLARGLRDAPTELRALLSEIGDHPAVAARLAHHAPSGWPDRGHAQSAAKTDTPEPPRATPAPEAETAGKGANASGGPRTVAEPADPRSEQPPAESSPARPAPPASDTRPGQGRDPDAYGPGATSGPPTQALGSAAMPGDHTDPTPAHPPHGGDTPPVPSSHAREPGQHARPPRPVPPAGQDPGSASASRPPEAFPPAAPDRIQSSPEASPPDPGQPLRPKDRPPVSGDEPSVPGTGEETAGPPGLNSPGRARHAEAKDAPPAGPHEAAPAPTGASDPRSGANTLSTRPAAPPHDRDTDPPTAPSSETRPAAEDTSPPRRGLGPRGADGHRLDPARPVTGHDAHARHGPEDTADPPPQRPEPEAAPQEPSRTRARLLRLLATPDGRAALIAPPDWPGIEAAHLALLPRLGGFAVTLLRAAAADPALGPRLAEASLTALVAAPPPGDARDWLARVLRSAGPPDPAGVLSASAARLAASDPRFAPLCDLLSDRPHPPPGAGADDAGTLLVARFLAGAPPEARAIDLPHPISLSAALDRLGPARVAVAMAARLGADRGALMAQILPLLARTGQAPVTVSDLPLVTLMAWARAAEPQPALELPGLLAALTRLAATRASVPPETMRDRIAQALQAATRNPAEGDAHLSAADVSRLLSGLSAAQTHLSAQDARHPGAPDRPESSAEPDAAPPPEALPVQERHSDRLDDPSPARGRGRPPRSDPARRGQQDLRAPAPGAPHTGSGEAAPASSDASFDDAARPHGASPEPEAASPTRAADRAAAAAPSEGADPSHPRIVDASADSAQSEPLPAQGGAVSAPPPEGPRAEADAAGAPPPGAASPAPGSRLRAGTSDSSRSGTPQGSSAESRSSAILSDPLETGGPAPRDPDSAKAPSSDAGSPPQDARPSTDTPPDTAPDAPAPPAAAGGAAPDGPGSAAPDPMAPQAEDAEPGGRPAAHAADAPATTRAARLGEAPSLASTASSMEAPGDFARQLRAAGLARDDETAEALVARALAVAPMDRAGGPDAFHSALAASLGVSRAELADGLASAQTEAWARARPVAEDADAALFRTAQALRRAGLNLDPPALSAHLDAAHGIAPIDAAAGPGAFHAALAASLGMPVDALLARLTAAPSLDAETSLFRTAQALRRAGLNLDPPALSAHLDAAHGIAPIDAAEGPGAFHAVLAASLGMPVDALLARLSLGPDPFAGGSQEVLLRMAQELRRAGFGMTPQRVLAALSAAHEAAPWDAPDGPHAFLAAAAVRLGTTSGALAQSLAAARMTAVATADPEPAADDATGPRAGQDTHTGLAGLVLLHVHLQTYLARSGCLDPAGALPEAQRPRAVHLLGLLASGRMDLPEHELALPKLLCGMPLGRPLPPGPDATPEEAELAESLLRFTASQVPAFENTDPAGLRETFVLRHGVIRRAAPDAPLTLQVTKGPFDMLLGGIPWPWSVVSLPWMPEALHVTWT